MRCIALILPIALSPFPAYAGLTTASGSADVERLSGYDGDVEVDIELSRGKAVIEISGEGSDAATCKISIEGKRIALNADFEGDTAGRCTGSSKQIFSADARYGNSVNGLRVCTSGGPFKMITGIEIESLPIYETGEFGAQAPRNRSYGDNCDRWHDWSRCDAREVMTGLTVHFSEPADGFSGTGYAAGLQALCHEIAASP